MDWTRARKILEIDAAAPREIPPEVLKKKYYLLALKYHPDKNPAADAAARFQEIHEAYEFLRGGTAPRGFGSIFSDFIKQIMRNKFAANIINEIAAGCFARMMELFCALEPSQMIAVYEILSKYRAVLHIPPSVFAEMEDAMAGTAPQTTIILNPTLENLLDAQIYQFQMGGEIYSVPLWHYELLYGGGIVVKCVPELPAGVTIDDANNIWCDVVVSAADLLDAGEYSFFLGERVFSFPVARIQWRTEQTITLKKCGIPADSNNVADASRRGDIHVRLRIMT